MGKAKGLLLVVLMLVVLGLARSALCAAVSPRVPPIPQPSNEFQLGRAAQEGSTVALAVTISEPGRLTASAPDLRRLSLIRKNPGTSTVRLRLTPRGLGALRGPSRHRLAVEVAFVFTPAGGVPRAKSRRIVFRS